MSKTECCSGETPHHHGECPVVSSLTAALREAEKMVESQRQKIIFEGEKFSATRLREEELAAQVSSLTASLGKAREALKIIHGIDGLYPGVYRRIESVLKEL